MSGKRHMPEEIIAKLRHVDVLAAQGTPVADAVRAIGVTEVASGRTAGWGDLLRPERGRDPDRELVKALQQPQHASLGYRPPALEAFVPGLAAWPTAQAGSALVRMMTAPIS